MSRVEGTRDEYIPYLLDSSDELMTILVPLGSNILLIGTSDAITPQINIADVNGAAAKCAFSFFVSSRQDAATYEVAKQLGISARASVSTTVRESISSVFTSIDQNAQATKVDGFGTKAAMPTGSTPHTYVVSFINCADQATAERIAAVVRIIVEAMSHHMPVRRIESITYASDYEKTLADLDRGFQSPMSLAPTSDEDRKGIATAPMVLRAEGIRCCVILQSWLGHALLSVDNDADFCMAVHTLWS
jgi:hypothetical protein